MTDIEKAMFPSYRKISQLIRRAIKVATGGVL